MLKRVKPDQVRLGMFIEAIDGNWGGQPFWRSRFLLNRPADVESLRVSGVKAIVINTSAGRDVFAESRKRLKAPRTVSAAQVALALQTLEASKPLITKLFLEARLGGSVPACDAMEAVELVVDNVEGSPQALIELSRIKTRDEYTFLHSIAVTALMVHLGKSIEMDAGTVRALGMGGLLHDVGKVEIPLNILSKSGPLTDSEMTLVRKHPASGYDLLSRQGDIPDLVLEICLNHHERLDGRGYPNGLSSDQISLPVRIASICDVYDALTSKRPYKRAWAPGEAATFMYKQEGQFDRPLLKQFFQSLNIKFN